jgi:hypothetical protein
VDVAGGEGDDGNGDGDDDGEPAAVGTGDIDDGGGARMVDGEVGVGPRPSAYVGSAPGRTVRAATGGGWARTGEVGVGDPPAGAASGDVERAAGVGDPRCGTSGDTGLGVSAGGPVNTSGAAAAGGATKNEARKQRTKYARG